MPKVLARDLLPGDYLVHQYGTVHGCVPSNGGKTRKAVVVLHDNRIIEYHPDDQVEIEREEQ